MYDLLRDNVLFVRYIHIINLTYTTNICKILNNGTHPLTLFERIHSITEGEINVLYTKCKVIH